jgi:hypothetical protein
MAKSTRKAHRTHISQSGWVVPIQALAVQAARASVLPARRRSAAQTSDDHPCSKAQAGKSLRNNACTATSSCADSCIDSHACNGLCYTNRTRPSCHVGTGIPECCNHCQIDTAPSSLRLSRGEKCSHCHACIAFAANGCTRLLGFSARQFSSR